MHVKKIYLLLLLITLPASVFSKDFKADDILGYWLSEEEDAVIQIYKFQKTYEGKLVWLKVQHTGEVPVPLDKDNPDKKLRSRKLNGLRNLWGFTFKDNEWSEGKVYDPLSGKTYKSKLSLENKNVLHLRGYIGVPLFGRTSQWKRQKYPLPDKYSSQKGYIETH